MFFSYGRYKGLRNASWRVYIEFRIKTLPVKVFALAKAAGIKVIENVRFIC